MSPQDLIELGKGGSLRAADYGLSVVEVSFLPLGVDPNAAAYRVVARDGTSLFQAATQFFSRNPFADF